MRAQVATFWIDGTGDERDAWPLWTWMNFKSLTLIIAHGARSCYRAGSRAAKKR